MFSRVVLWTSLLSIWCQILCIRLSQRCRQTLAEAMADEYPTVIRYLQYAIAEFSVIITDLPEVIGFGFAIKIFLGWPTWIGVLCSLATTMLFLSSQYFGFRALEGIIMCFVGIMSIVIFVQWSMTTTDWAMFWKGALIPGVSGIKPDALTILGLIGCVVMPHNLYLHSAAAMTRGDIPRTKKHVERAIQLSSLDLILPIFVTIAINWGIVVLSAENIYQNPSAANSGIADFCRYFSNMGDAGCILWGVALLAAAQSSSITTTYTGQYVMEGFLKLRLSLWKRAILTRLLAILPAVAIAASYSDNTLQHMIDWVNASLAVLLPFALIPLIKFNTSERKMGSAVPSLVEKVALWILGVAVICVNVLTVKLQSKEDSKPFNFLWDLKHNTVQNLLLLAYVLFLVYVFLKPVRGKKGNYREIRSFEPAF